MSSATGHSRRSLQCIALATLLFLAQTAPGQAGDPQRIKFPFENQSDLRGLFNAFHAFGVACLDQPVTANLPERLLPEGYRIVKRGVHLFGEDTPTLANTAIITKTGTEEGDFAEGYPYIDFSMPGAQSPDGACRLVWHRAWDYESGLDDIMLSTAAQFNSHLSYRLSATLISRPDDTFLVSDHYGLFSEWATQCWQGLVCQFSVLGVLDPEKGIELTLTRQKRAGAPINR